ncbi:MAG: UDP-N-acetylmuramoyl-L-alanine--D-glutamate ligase [Myxococcota bacterium]
MTVEWTGRDVLVLGFGMSGRSAAAYCARQGARVVVADERPAAAMPEAASLPPGVEGRFGRPFPDLERFDLVVPSPGIALARYAGRAKRAWGDIELAAQALAARGVPIVAVTGTNGKSTVVRLIEAMAQAAGLRAKAGGNIGVPALELLDAPLELAVLEVSSFQLESVETFRPCVAVLLNLSPDHYDRHGDMAGYLAAKARIFARQGPGDHAVVNGDDAFACSAPIPEGVERLYFFRTDPTGTAPPERSARARAWIAGDGIALRRGGRAETIPLADAPGLALQRENVAAAALALAALADTLPIDLARAAAALPAFQGLPHRCVRVAERSGVVYYDDSKATNLGAAARSLETMTRPVVWIAGGRHKGADLAPLAASARGRVRVALLIGEAAPELERALAGHVPCERVGELAKAVARAAELARPGDAVLLAPACSSFDQFRSFEDRGLQFVAAVKRLADSGSPT